MEPRLRALWQTIRDPIVHFSQVHPLGKAFLIALAIVLGILFAPITIGLVLLWLTLRFISPERIKWALATVIVFLTAFLGTVWIYAMIFGPITPSSPGRHDGSPHDQAPGPADQTARPDETDPNDVAADPVEATPGQIQANTSPTYPVTRIIDGDTITVSISATDETVRLIGLDTPEISRSTGEAACFGAEATQRVRTLLSGRHVRLEPDPTQSDRDSYGRLLRYVYLPDGRLLNQLLIEHGYGREYTHITPYQHQTEFRQAEYEARESQRGLWASDACG